MMLVWSNNEPTTDLPIGDFIYVIDRCKRDICFNSSNIYYTMWDAVVRDNVSYTSPDNYSCNWTLYFGWFGVSNILSK